MTESDVFYLGKITKKHGLKGSFKVFLDVDDPFLYDQLDHAYIETDGQWIPFFFEYFDVQSDGRALAKFEDVGPDELPQWIGCELFLPLEALPALEGKQFYYHEIEGWQVAVLTQGDGAQSDPTTDRAMQEIGRVQSVEDNNGQGLLRVKPAQQNLEDILIPLVDSFIHQVDRENHRLIFDLPDGLIELNQ